MDKEDKPFGYIMVLGAIGLGMGAFFRFFPSPTELKDIKKGQCYIKSSVSYIILRCGNYGCLLARMDKDDRPTYEIKKYIRSDYEERDCTL